MRDIWEVLLQTLTVSAIGLYILLIKTIFKDKLPPRWQFSVWVILLIGLILPASGRGMLSFLTETVKTLTAGEFTVSRPVSFFPLLTNFSEVNLSNALFLIYLSGIAVFGAKYLFSYVRLRLIIRKCSEASEENKAAIEETAKEYSLPVCKAVTLNGVTSPFVCGIFSPVMVLPEYMVDKKIIMHELLHLKHKDIVFGAIICIFRCLHWFNPVLHYLFNRINNDIEELCDSRVIERLEGEDIREYGNILLSMANEKYASFPGTSSAANGGKNIQSRIKTLVRHNNYPKNSSFISACITIVLAACLLLTGNNSVFPSYIRAKSASDTKLIMSAVRSFGCTTPAGALDAYGKAVVYKNAIYRALSAPLSEHDTLSEIIENSFKESGKPVWDTGLDGAPANGGEFLIYNFLRNPDGSYNALLVIQMPYYDPEEENNERYATRELHIFKEDDRWVVMPLSDFSYTVTYKMLNEWGCDDLPGIKYTAKTDDFIIEYNYQLCFCFENNDSHTVTKDPSTSAYFSVAYVNTYSSVTYIGTEENKSNITTLGLATETYSREDEFPEFSNKISGTFSSSSSSGSFVSSTGNRELRDNKALFGGGGHSTDPDKIQSRIPECIAAGLYVNGELTDTLILERVN